jgi:glycosyltransferase involved in cell wall biosynthesis
MDAMGQVICITANFEWMGTHSGYGRFLSYLPKGCCEPVLASSLRGRRIFAGAARAALRGYGLSSVGSQSACTLLMRLWLSGGIVHVLYGEDHARIVRWLSAFGLPMIATLHQPKSVHERVGFEALGAARAVITLFRRDIEHYRGLIEGRQVHFIPHGVDCGFFRPAEASGYERRILIVGHWLRDWNKIGAILEIVRQEAPSVVVDVVASSRALDHPALARLVEQGKVAFMSGLSDEELLALYQRSAVMLCPFVDTGANNAIVEALACGLPIVTNDVGGIRDYGGGSVFETSGTGSSTELAALCLRYLIDARWRAETSKAQRDFAQKELDWGKIARMHLEVYADHSGRSA